MKGQSHWTFKTVCGAILLTLIALPFWLIWGPFYIIIRTIVTIWQPILYKKQSAKWNKAYQENLEEGIHIDYPPTEGTIMGIGPWKIK